jgi:hypothetical protein
MTPKGREIDRGQGRVSLRKALKHWDNFYGRNRLNVRDHTASLNRGPWVIYLKEPTDTQIHQ